MESVAPERLGQRVDRDLPIGLHDGSSRARSNGLELVSQTFGRPDGRSLLLIMGLGAQMIGWHEPFCRMPMDRGHYVIRFDNRDVGRPTAFDGASVANRFALVAGALRGMPLIVPCTLRDMAEDTAGLLDALQIEHVAAHAGRSATVS